MYEFRSNGVKASRAHGALSFLSQQEFGLLAILNAQSNTLSALGKSNSPACLAIRLGDSGASRRGSATSIECSFRILYISNVDGDRVRAVAPHPLACTGRLRYALAVLMRELLDQLSDDGDAHRPTIGQRIWTKRSLCRRCPAASARTHRQGRAQPSLRKEV